MRAAGGASPGQALWRNIGPVSGDTAMKVHSSQSSYYTAPLLSQSNSDSDDDTPFSLPDDDSSQKNKATSLSSTSMSSAANSISSGFWLNQSGASATDTSTAAASTDDADSTDDTTTSDPAEDILSQFAKWADMSPSERIRSQYLEQQNLTEEQFAQLPSDQQKAINDQITAQIKQQLGGKSGETDDDSDGGSSAVSLG
jgi:hypothetical protein